MLIIIMGVCGSGKTTLGKLFAKKHGWRFIDADDFHSEANIVKMNEGRPLNDEDRFPWLQALHRVIESWKRKSDSGVLACSALKESYRNILIHGKPDGGEREPRQLKGKTLVVYLKGDKDVIAKRMSCRKGHFMSAKLTDSQFETLEEPDPLSPNTLTLSITDSVEDNVSLIDQTLLKVFNVSI